MAYELEIIDLDKGGFEVEILSGHANLDFKSCTFLINMKTPEFVKNIKISPNMGWAGVAVWRRGCFWVWKGKQWFME